MLLNFDLTMPSYAKIPEGLEEAAVSVWIWPTPKEKNADDRDVTQLLST
jgi:hypothetical protein